MKLYLAYFKSYRYPEDDYIIGIFSSEAIAKKKIQEEIAHDKEFNKNYPDRYQQSEDHYVVEEFLIDKDKWGNDVNETHEDQ